MIPTRERKLGRILLASLLLAPGVWADDKGAKSKGVEGATTKIQWGQHWAGPKIRGAKNLEGKVVLLKIWGG